MQIITLNIILRLDSKLKKKKKSVMYVQKQKLANKEKEKCIFLSSDTTVLIPGCIL